MRVFKKVLLIAAPAALMACEYPFDLCFGSDCSETGGQENEALYCSAPINGRWICLLNDKDDPRVIKAIEDGLFNPWTDDGTCPYKERTWSSLQRTDPIAQNYASPLRAAVCTDSEYAANVKNFSICLPEQSAWPVGGGAVGAVSLFGKSVAPDCSSIEPYAFLYDYLYTAPCAEGVSCLGWWDECSCKCEDDASCIIMQDALENNYFGEDQDGLIPGGWESACTGYPWRWDPQAYGSGGFRGTTCEWNASGPSPGDIPSPLHEMLDILKCDGYACHIPDYYIDSIIASPGLVVGSSAIQVVDSIIEIIECNHLCDEIGLIEGDRITSIGRQKLRSLDPVAWVQAYDELLNGLTEFEITTSSSTQTITIIMETDR